MSKKQNVSTGTQEQPSRRQIQNELRKIRAFRARERAEGQDTATRTSEYAVAVLRAYNQRILTELSEDQEDALFEFMRMCRGVDAKLGRAAIDNAEKLVRIAL